MMIQVSPSDKYDESFLVGWMMSDIQNGILILSHVNMRLMTEKLDGINKFSITLLADTVVCRFAGMDFSTYHKPEMYYSMAAGFEYKPSLTQYMNLRKEHGLMSFDEESEKMVQDSFKKLGLA